MKRVPILLLFALALPLAAADNAAPVITAHVSGATGENGWFVSDVALVWSVDGADARVQAGCESTMLAFDTTGDPFLCAATSRSGGLSTATYTIRRDTAPPVITYSGNARTYDIDEMVTIRCDATDSVSGIATTTCDDIRGPAYTFPTGLNTFATTAIDRAGHHAEGSVTFRIIVSPQGLGTLVDAWVTNDGVAAILRRALVRGDVTGFVARVTREAGHTIAPQLAAELIRLAAAV